MLICPIRQTTFEASAQKRNERATNFYSLPENERCGKVEISPREFTEHKNIQSLLTGEEDSLCQILL